MLWELPTLPIGDQPRTAFAWQEARPTLGPDSGGCPPEPERSGGVRWLWDPPSGASGEQGGQANGCKAQSDCHARAPGGSPKIPKR